MLSPEKSSNNANRWIKWLVGISIGAIIIIFVIFLWNRSFFDFSTTVDEGLLGTLGDLIGGFLGSIWALVGVVLFYKALTSQQEDFRTNKKALTKQIESLEMQTKEFSLQRNELELTRNVFLEQSKTLKKQQFESTFFSMIQMYSENIAILNTSRKKDYFVEFSELIASKNIVDDNPINNHNDALETYNEFFFQKKDEVSHYFRIVYRILRFIDSSMMSDKEKIFYAKILRSQFSEKELLILYYNSHTIFGRKFIPLALRYNLFKHLPNDSKVELKKFETDSIETGFRRLIFIQELRTSLLEFIDKVLNEEIHDKTTSFENSHAGIIIKFEAEDIDLKNVKISMLEINTDKLEDFLELKMDECYEYFHHHLYQMFVFATYSEYQEGKMGINKDRGDNFMKYEVWGNKILKL